MRSRKDRRNWLGALFLVVAILVFGLSVAMSVGTANTAYVWHDNMISDLGDSSCRLRGSRRICSPNFLLFNVGVLLAGVLLAAAGSCLRKRWGNVLAGSVVIMSIGLVIIGVFPAGEGGRAHLAGVVLALVVPGFGLLVSGIRPETPWLHLYRAPRAVLGAVALFFAAESRLPESVVPRGAGELIIVGALLLAFLLEAARLLAAGAGEARQISRSDGGTGATGSASQ